MGELMQLKVLKRELVNCTYTGKALRWLVGRKVGKGTGEAMRAGEGARSDRG